MDDKMMSLLLAADGGGAGGAAETVPAPAAASSEGAAGQSAPDAAASAAGAGTPPVAAAETPAPAAAAGASEEVEEEWRGWWASQLPKETRDKYKERLLPLKGKKMADVFDDYFATGDKLKGAVVFPGRDAKPEEIDAFLKKMNIPKAASEYNMDAAKLPADWTEDGKKETIKTLGEMCRRNGLTLRQGAAVFDLYAGHIEAINRNMAAQREEAKASFEKRLLDECGDEKATTETREYFKRAIVALGDKRLVKELTDSGLFYNPVVVRAIADLWKAGNSEPPVMNAGGGRDAKKTDGGLPKGQEFIERYGNRRAV